MATKKTNKKVEVVEEKSSLDALKVLTQNAIGTAYKAIKLPIGLFSYKAFLGFVVGCAVGYGGIPVNIEFLPQKTIEKQEKVIVNNLGSYVKKESKSLSKSQKEDLIKCYETVLNGDYSESYEIREALREQVQRTFADDSNIKNFSDKLSKKLNSLNIKEDVQTIKDIFREIVDGLDSSKLFNMYEESLLQIKVSEDFEKREEQYKKEIEELKNKPCVVPQQQNQYQKRYR